MTLSDAYETGRCDAANAHDGDRPPDVETLAAEYLEFHAWDDEPECERAAIARAWAEGWHASAMRYWRAAEARRAREEAEEAY
jgi:hypothetical protein